MSLLNDMLRDLVRHQKAVVAPAILSHDIMQDTKLFKHKTSSWILSAIIFAVVFSSVFVFKYFFTESQFSRNLPSPVINKPAVEKEVLPASQQNSLVDVALANAIAAESHKSKTVTQGAAFVRVNNEQVQRDIADLLLQANRALIQDKLTSPIEDNAYSYFQTIATLSPNHPQAKIGLELIAARYLEKAREQLSLGNFQQAEIARQRANFVAPAYFREHDFSDADVLMMKNSGSVATAAAQSVVTASMPQSETIKPFVVAEVASLNVVPNAGWKDEQLAAQADELMRQGKQAEALQLLKNFVVSEAKPTRSTLLLGDIYFQQNNAEALEIVLKSAEFLSAVDKAKLRAQMLAAQGDQAAAISELEQQLGGAENNEQYRSFLASLYHKTGQYQQSVLSYQRLLDSYGDKPSYWLGLALAFDGLLQNKNALQAYQHLLNFPQLQQQVRDYINQRIAALRDE